MDNEKKYKELVGKIKKAYLYTQAESTKAVLEDILPELAESKDEKIRKELIEHIKANKEVDYVLFQKFSPEDVIAWLEKLKVFSEHGYGLYYFASNGFAYVGNTTYDNVSWLEKQGEKPQGKSALEAINEEKADNANKVEQKFHEGDWITNGQLTCKVLTVTSKSYDLHLYNDDYCHFETDIQSINKDYHLWTIKDAKDGDVLYSLDSNQPFIYKERNIHEQATAYCGINKYGKFFVWNTKDCIITLDKYIPATKEQRDILKKAMNDAGWQFDFERKELKKIESNPAWSEEDEQRIKKVMHIISCDGRISNEECKSIFDWLKSLKDRVGCEANCTTTKELSESDEEEFQIAIDTLAEAGQRDSAHWLESIKQRIGG